MIGPVIGDQSALSCGRLADEKQCKHLSNLIATCNGGVSRADPPSSLMMLLVLE